MYLSLLRVQRYDIFGKKHKNTHKISLETCTIQKKCVLLQPETLFFGVQIVEL